jgi:hypothetical protein
MLVDMDKITLEQEYQHMRLIVNEKQWRQYLAVEAKQRGSASLVAGAARVSLNTVKGHSIKKSALAEVLHAQGFSLPANKKTIAGKSHADRDGQFAHISSTCKQSCGKALYPGKTELLITADGGGSTGVKNRLWKKKLQALATQEQLTIPVVHYPPATSKWNKIEHRLFSFISINWRATPLTSVEVVLELISHTTTKEGLAITAIKDSHTYPTGIKVSDDELAALNLSRDSYHGEWNYTIKPQGS